MKKRYDYDKRYLITLNLYNHDIPFKKPASGKLQTLEDYNDFILKNKDLIKTIWSVEDSLIRIGKNINKGGSFEDKNGEVQTLNDALNNILLSIITNKAEERRMKKSGKFDDKLFKDDFYNEPISNFKSLFHN